MFGHRRHRNHKRGDERSAGVGVCAVCAFCGYSKSSGRIRTVFPDSLTPGCQWRSGLRCMCVRISERVYADIYLSRRAGRSHGDQNTEAWAQRVGSASPEKSPEEPNPTLVASGDLKLRLQGAAWDLGSSGAPRGPCLIPSLRDVSVLSSVAGGSKRVAQRGWMG